MKYLHPPRDLPIHHTHSVRAYRGKAIVHTPGRRISLVPWIAISLVFFFRMTMKCSVVAFIFLSVFVFSGAFVFPSPPIVLIPMPLCVFFAALSLRAHGTRPEPPAGPRGAGGHGRAAGGSVFAQQYSWTLVSWTAWIGELDSKPMVYQALPSPVLGHL